MNDWTLNCLGDATIILADGTTNTVKGFHVDYPGIHVPSGKTLTITGTGMLRASSKGFGAGIGGGYKIGTNKPIKDSRGRNAAWVFFAKYFVFYFVFCQIFPIFARQFSAKEKK